MKKMVFVMLALAAVLMISAGPALAAEANVMIEKKADLGSFLVDGKKMTLYYFTKDSAGKSACAGDCVTKWPLFHVDKVMPGAGLNAADFGVITREDGKKQTTYKGFPLYYFFQDKAAGEAKGQGVNNVWYVIDPAKFPPAK